MHEKRKSIYDRLLRPTSNLCARGFRGGYQVWVSATSIIQLAFGKHPKSLPLFTGGLNLLAIAQQHNTVALEISRGVPAWPLGTDYYIVDGNENELHEEPDEAHDNKAAGSPEGHLRELCNKQKQERMELIGAQIWCDWIQTEIETPKNLSRREWVAMRATHDTPGIWIENVHLYGQASGISWPVGCYLSQSFESVGLRNLPPPSW